MNAAAAVTEAPILEVSQLRVSYDGVLALSDVSLKVEPNRIVALVGGNGNGKSTTLRAIAGLNAVDAGAIHFMGQPSWGSERSSEMTQSSSFTSVPRPRARPFS